MDTGRGVGLGRLECKVEWLGEREGEIYFLN